MSPLKATMPARNSGAGIAVEKGSAGRMNRSLFNPHGCFSQGPIACAVAGLDKEKFVTEFPIIATHFGDDAWEVGDGS